MDVCVDGIIANNCSCRRIEERDQDGAHLCNNKCSNCFLFCGTVGVVS